MTVINLAVRSRNSSVYDTAVTQGFVVDRIGDIRSNQNADTTHSVTEAGDAAASLDAWAIYGTGDLLYWKLSNSGSVRTVTLYRGQNGALPVATGSVTNDGVIYGTSLNQSGISFEVTVTYTVDDTDNANTVQCTTYSDELDFELPGSTQFTYLEANEEVVKYTVTETVDAINALINAGESTFLEGDLSLTTAQISTLGVTAVEVIGAPLAGQVVEILSAIAVYDYSTAAFSVNTTLDLVSTTGTRLWTAATAISGTADKITRFIPVAGVIQAGEAISVKVNTGNPTVASGCAGTVKLMVMYRITDL